MQPTQKDARLICSVTSRGIYNLIKKFISGLVFGFGFSIAVMIAVTIWINVVVPIEVQRGSSVSHGSSRSVTIEPDNKYPLIENFSDLSLDQKIEHASAILITSISKGADGSYESRVSEILKKPDDVSLYYKIGDEFDHHMAYEKYESEGMSVPKGFIVFMNGNPATEKYSMSYSGERIRSLGDITMEQFREKCGS